jgi:hypothetical protein
LQGKAPDDESLILFVKLLKERSVDTRRDVLVMVTRLAEDRRVVFSIRCN